VTSRLTNVGRREGIDMVSLLRLTSWIGLLSAIVLCALPAVADVVHLKDGRTVEGKIVAETPDHVEVKQRYGTIKIDRKEIKRIEAVVSKTEQYERALKEAKTLEEFRKLVAWCDENEVAGSEARKRVEDLEIVLKKENNPNWCRPCDARGVVNCAPCNAQGTVTVECRACGSEGKFRCSACPGSVGKVTCAGCAGDAKVLAPCAACGGDGAASCDGCRGTGKTRCSGCGGSRYRTEYYDEVIRDALGRVIGTRRATRQVVCVGCNGTGSLQCARCVGAGTLPCTPCGTKGSVVVVCPKCRGAGATTCATCKGSGALDCAKCKDGANVVTCDFCRGKRRAKCRPCGGSGIGELATVEGASIPAEVTGTAAPAGR